ncbi:MAG: hypothetical protein K9K21_05550 [Desulfotignum sp.]|nr:hypothetical protein [Desulfotignum sp.]MCF8113299.1 hypothetical protein [Desulfotignum sp.]MCF8125049.1 hypothetical protein [Desulfotignum sp.]
MYALIYDDPDRGEPAKMVISVHGTRKEADQALLRRRCELERPVWECHTRIVWTDKAVSGGEKIHRTEFTDWKNGEKIPEGELHSDED